MAAAWNDLPATGGLGECAALVSSAEALRVSAPELSVQLARRALLVGATDASADTTNIGEARNLSMRAQALLASGLVRISQHAKAVEPGFAALALAESGGAQDLAAQVRIDLAACAQQVGEPLLGGAILRPVLEATQTPPSVRAVALGRLVGCVAHAARRDDIEDSLAEADRLLAADDGLTPDVRRIERARLAVRTASYHRWYGDTEDAVTSARGGLNLLTRLRSDLRSESDRLRARLTLELVCGLLDEGEPREAENAAHPTVDEPVRATSAASVGRLMLALATRVYLPSGQTDRGRHLLDQAAWMAERHALDGLRADSLTEISRLDEQAGRPADALEAMRTARAAEHRRMRAMSRAARHVLVEVGANHGIRDSSQQSVAALMRQISHPAALPAAPAQVGPSQESRQQRAAAALGGTVDMDDSGTRLLDREALFHRLRSVRGGERPVALTLVRFEPNKDGGKDGGKDEARGPDTGIMVGLADKVRDMAPENAEVARSDGGELAVILPATTRDQAEEFAATIRESDWAGVGGKDMSISTGVVQTDQATTDAAGILTAARDALTPAQTTSALSEETPTRRLNNNARPAEVGPTGRSVLSSLTIPSGSGGRRRAGEEQAPGAKSRGPSEPAEAPLWTRAERRARQEPGQPTDPTPTPPNGLPVPADEPSQGKRAATPTRPSFSETNTGGSTVAMNRTHLPTRHGKPPAELANTADTPPPSEPAQSTGQSTSHITAPTAGDVGVAKTADGAGLPRRGAFAASGSEGESASGRAAGTSGGVGLSGGRVFSGAGELTAGAVSGQAAGAAEGTRLPATGSAMNAERAGTSEPEAAERVGRGAAAGETERPDHTGGDDTGISSGLAGLSSGGILRGSGNDDTPATPAASGRSSYEETKAELARMMSALNAKSLAARERKNNGTPPAPEPGQRSGLMAAFDALTGPAPGLRAKFDDAAELPARKPAKSWAELESAGVVESPADDLFGVEADEKSTSRSSLGAAFAEFGETEKKVTEPVKETVQEHAYDEPLGPRPQPDDLPRRGEKSSATIASLLTEALAAYQSTAEDVEEHRAPERFDSFASDDPDRQQSGVRGRHRSPE